MGGRDQWYNRLVKRMGPENVAALIDEKWFDFAEDWEKVKYPREGWTGDGDTGTGKSG